jgi:sugar phosphate permease
VSTVDSTKAEQAGGDAEPVPVPSSWRNRLPVFYGWFIVGASFVALGLSYTVWYSFSVFYVALLGQFGWSRAASAGVFSLYVIVYGLAGAAAGALSDRFGPRKVVAVGVAFLTAGMVGCSQMTELWQFYLSYGVIAAIGSSAAGWVPCVATVSCWFSRRLGTALGVASAGIGVGILIMVPLTQMLINWYGWRSAYQILAAIILVGVTPVALVVLRGRPEELGMVKDGRPADYKDGPGKGGPAISRVVDRQWASREWTVGSAVREPRFWLLAAMLMLANTATQMILVHQVAFLVDGGLDSLLAASVAGLVGLFSVGAKIGWGWVSDRLGREMTFTLGLSCMWVAVAALIATRLTSSALLLYLFPLAFALAYGTLTPLGPAIAADLFTGPRFGSIYGAAAISQGLGSASGAWFAGYVFDSTGSYFIAFGIAAVCSFLSVIVCWLIAPRLVRMVPGRARARSAVVQASPNG